MARRIAAGCLMLALGAWPAAGHDEESTAEQREAVRATVDRLRKILEEGYLSAGKAAKFEFKGLSTHDLMHVLDTAKLAAVKSDIAKEPQKLRDALARVCRTTIHRRSPLGQLQKSSDICFLLASSHRADWVAAHRLLRREPFGEKLDRAVIALARDTRPEVRLLATLDATMLVAFGRKAEGLVATVLAGMTDQNPNVAAVSTYWAAQTRDPRVVDRMIASLSDSRLLNPGSSPLWDLGGPKESKVSDIAMQKLRWLAWNESDCGLKWRAPVPGTEKDWTGQPRAEYVALTPDAIRSWWKRSRAEFGFGVSKPMWKCVFDEVVLLKIGQPKLVRLAMGVPVRITLTEYTERLNDGEPVTSVEVQAELIDARPPGDENEYSIRLGNPRHSDWWVPRHRMSWTGDNIDGSMKWKVAFLPTHRRKYVRARLVVHLEHE